MDKIFDYYILGNSLKSWLIAAGIIIGACIVARLCQRVLLSRLRKAAARTNNQLDDMVISIVERSVMPLVYIYSIYAGLHYLKLDTTVQQVMKGAVLFVAVFFIVRAISQVLGYFVERFNRSREADESQVRQARGIMLIVKILLWLIGIIFLIDNLGYDITTIVTGLGIGGIAIALAAQAVLADLFSYLVIFFDKPFETGDFIMAGDKSGVVEYIGVKTTRIRTLSGEQLVMSNTDLTNSRIQNFKRLEKRRVVLTIGVTYETDQAKLAAIPGMIRNLVEPIDLVQFDRSHFTGFGDFSLNFETAYYILSADYNYFMDVQQQIGLGLIKLFADEGIEFAYPTQKLFLQRSES